jgi:hypothetical protein
MSLHVPRWTTPSEPRSKISLQPGTTVPRFLHPRFDSRFTENLREWLKPSSRGGPSAMPKMLAVNAQARSQDFWRSQALSLMIYCCGLILISSPWSKPPSKEGPTTADHITTLFPDLSEYTRRLPPSTDAAKGGGGGGKRSATPVTIGRAPKFTTIQLAPPSLRQDAASKLIAEASLLGDPALQFPSPNLDRFGDPLAGLMTDSDGQGRGGGMGDGDGTGKAWGRDWGREGMAERAVTHSERDTTAWAFPNAYIVPMQNIPKRRGRQSFRGWLFCKLWLRQTGAPVVSKL